MPANGFGPFAYPSVTSAGASASAVTSNVVLAPCVLVAADVAVAAEAGVLGLDVRAAGQRGRLGLVARRARGREPQRVEVDVAVVAGRVRELDRVLARVERDVVDVELVARPRAGRRQRDLPAGAVDDQADRLRAVERVRAVGVAQRHPVVAGLLRVDVDPHRRAHRAEAGDEAGAAVAGVLGVELRATGEHAVLELVEPFVDGRDVAGQRVERVPRLGAQQLRAVLRVERPRRAHVARRGWA